MFYHHPVLQTVVQEKIWIFFSSQQFARLKPVDVEKELVT